MTATASPDGLLVIDKPAGLTSHDVVARARRRLGTRRVGHAGTLDPMATGVLLLGVGRATRLLGYLAKQDKEYVATIRLGASTVTDDREGELLRSAEPRQVDELASDRITDAMAVLTGVIMQVPSAVSAIKVQGRRAHARVRDGESVELAAREVTVHSFELLAEHRQSGLIDLDVRVVCSTGTYVRALARDLGRLLGVGGHLTSLCRTRVGAWGSSEAIGLEAWEQVDAPEARLLSIDEAARRSLPVLVVADGQAVDVAHGQRLDWPRDRSDAVLALLDGRGELLALGERTGSKVRYLAVFAPPVRAGRS